MKQRINGNIVSRPELARQPHVCRRVNASKRGRFKSIGRWKFVRALVDTNPASRTPRPAAAHGNMWSPRTPADLQNRETNRSFDRNAIRIGDGETLMASSPITNLRGAENDADDTEPGVADPFFQLRTSGGTLWIFGDAHRFHLFEPGRVGLSASGSGHAHLGETEECTGGNEHVSEKDDGKCTTVATAKAQPEMQTDGKMAPDEKNKKDLPISGPWIDPEVGDLVWIVDVDAGKDAGAAGVYDVDEQEIGNS